MSNNSENNKSKKESSKKLPHSGHRQRVIKKYLEYGLSSFSEHEVLELILFFSIPRRDTNEIAHKIIDEFGSLENVLEASPEDFVNIEGVGEHSVALLSLFRAVYEYKNTKLYDKRVYFKNTFDIGMFCLKYFSQHNDESAILLAMDANFQLKKVSVISEGTVNQTAFYPAKIMKIALNLRAPLVVIAHNHPNGNVQPSGPDITLTKELNELLLSARIELMDHIICNDQFFTSLRERGYFDEKIEVDNS